MDPKNIELELADDFYYKIKERKNLTPAEIKQLIKFVDETKYIMNFGKLGPQGLKAARNIYSKLFNLESKHRLKKELKNNQGLFSQA